MFVGDLIDRGPQLGAGGRAACAPTGVPGVRPVFLLGNHEEVLLRILAGEAGLIAKLAAGSAGRECLESYGVESDAARGQRTTRRRSAASRRRFRSDARRVPAELRRYLPLRRLSVRPCRDPARVRARPATASPTCAGSASHSCSTTTDHGFVVVHGHTISREVEERPNRIGIDTGAYRSGVLTALAIEGSRALDARYAARLTNRCCGARIDLVHVWSLGVHSRKRFDRGIARIFREDDRVC